MPVGCWVKELGVACYIAGGLATLHGLQFVRNVAQAAPQTLVAGSSHPAEQARLMSAPLLKNKLHLIVTLVPGPPAKALQVSIPYGLP